ncbi:MAG: 2,3-bisphosphoglycerate-independent phosphoglycerate mutase [Acidobacteriota bacterium]
MARLTRGPLLLAVLDGWGLAEDGAFNAVTRSGLQNFPAWLKRFPCRPLCASGEAVGLPGGQIGNSEVGHLTLGSGRVIFQDLPRISRAIGDGSFFRNSVLRDVCQAARGGTLHLMGLVSDGGVHSHVDHLKALVTLAGREGVSRVAIHAITDGRDVSPTSGIGHIADVRGFLEIEGIGSLATIMGRYYAMDRDRRWERTEVAYRAFTRGEGARWDDAEAAIRASYASGVTDEFVRPIVLPCPFGTIRDGDAVLFFNFRADRARQISRALADPRFADFHRGEPPRLSAFSTLTRYHRDFPFPVAFERDIPANTLGEVVASAGLRQLRIAETEKYAHVTFFFSGGREAPFPGEDRILIPSPKVATYDLRPAMSAAEVTEALLAALDRDYGFLLLNFANPDMVGHTGDFGAACEAARTVDQCMGRVVEKVLGLGGAVALTADHGNLETMREPDGVHIHTAHTTNPVPFLWLSRDPVGLRKEGNPGLASVAPTLLEWLGLPRPPEMDAPSLFGPS